MSWHSHAQTECCRTHCTVWRLSVGVLRAAAVGGTLMMARGKCNAMRPISEGWRGAESLQLMPSMLTMLRGLWGASGEEWEQ